MPIALSNYLPSFDCLTAKCPFPALDKYRAQFTSSPLFGRIRANWKVMLMDCSTVIAASCVVLTFLNGSAIICSMFLLLTATSAIAAFYMRQISSLTDLETSVQQLRETRDRLEGVAANLEHENDRLAETNRELLRTNAAFQNTNQDLQQTNQRLTAQVAQLTLQSAQLRASAEQIRNEVARFGEANTHLGGHVQGLHQSLERLDREIVTSQGLCQLITNQLAAQQQGLAGQLDQLRAHIEELRAENRVLERMQQLDLLRAQIQQAAGELHNLQLRYAEDSARFDEIHQALVQLRGQFDTTLQGYRDNNAAFQTGITALAAERQRIHDLLTRFPQPTTIAVRA